MDKRFLQAIAFLAGTIIGAGIFSLPYIFSQLGLVLGFVYVVFFLGVYFLIHFMYAQLVAVSKREHHFFYLADRYLPRWSSKFASLMVLGELVFTLLVYLVLASSFVSLIFSGGGLVGMLVFWVMGSAFIFVSLGGQGWTEVVGIVCVLAIVLIVVFAGSGESITTPMFKSVSVPMLLLPFGPLLFSFAGRPAVPKVIEEYRRAGREGDSFSLWSVLFLGTALPLFVYLAFVIGVLRLSPQVAPEALVGLSLSPLLMSLLGVMGLVILWTSYFVIGANVKDILKVDLKKSGFWAGVVPVVVPLLLYFVGFRSFLGAISFAGGVFLALEGAFIVSMWRKAFPKSRWRWLCVPLYIVFLISLVYGVGSVIV